MGETMMGMIDKVLRKEVDVARFLPYTSLVTSSVVKLREQETYVFSVEMRGVASGCAGADDINHWHAQLNQLTRQIADPRVALHSHAINDEVSHFPEGEFTNRFARDYNAKYRAMLAARKMHSARLFLSVVYRPQARTERVLTRLAPPPAAVLEQRQTEDLAVVDDLIHTVLAGLEAFGPQLLDCYEHEGVMCSGTLELFSRIVNGAWRRVAVPRAEIRDILSVTRSTFGYGGLMSLKGATGIEYGAILGIKEYPTPTVPGMLDGLLAQGYPWVLSQSFTYVSDIAAQEWMVEQRKRLVNAGDLAVSQVREIDEKLDALASRKLAMGHHELSLYIPAPDEDTLNERVAAAGVVLSGTKMTWLREDIALGSAFLAMLPGNLYYRVDPAMIDNTNFSGMIRPREIPVGRLSGAQWGPATTLFESEAGTPVAFSWHQPDPDPAAKLDPNHKEPATTLLIGGTGRGKTVVLGHLLTQSQKFAVFPEGFPGVSKLSCVVFDKDLGMAIVVPALGGKYYLIKTGVPSGLAPFQMEPSPASLDFLDRLVTRLVTRPGLALSLAQQKKITESIHGVMGADKHLRRMGALLEFFDESEPDGLYARLAPWCAGDKYGWLFDNEVDTMDMDYPVVGFDVTDFLLHPETCTPLMMYLLYRVDSLMDGRRIPIFIDEAPTVLGDPQFRGYVERALVQIRKKDGFLVLAAQYPRQFLDSPLAAALVSQPATMIFLADPKADMNDLVRCFKLTVSEVNLIRGLGKRQALLRQGTTSTVIDLTLTGFEDEIAVLSGNTVTSMLCQRVIDEVGPDPDRWLPEFQRRRRIG
jgi:type IV secretion system protein VirB4